MFSFESLDFVRIEANIGLVRTKKNREEGRSFLNFSNWKVE